MKKITLDRKIRRKRRISSKIFGIGDKPRISVFASNRYTYVQVIDDAKKNTLAAFSSLDLKKNKSQVKRRKVEEAKLVGVELAKIANEKGIKKAVFDRGRYTYKGRVKALVEGMREGGLEI